MKSLRRISTAVTAPLLGAKREHQARLGPSATALACLGASATALARLGATAANLALLGAGRVHGQGVSKPGRGFLGSLDDEQGVRQTQLPLDRRIEFHRELQTVDLLVRLADQGVTCVACARSERAIGRRSLRSERSSRRPSPG